MIRKEKSTRDLHIRDRITSIGLDIVDAITEELFAGLRSGSIEPAVVVCTLVHLFTNATINDTRKLLGLNSDRYGSANINKTVRDILINANKRREKGGDTNG